MTAVSFWSKSRADWMYLMVLKPGSKLYLPDLQYRAGHTVIYRTYLLITYLYLRKLSLGSDSLTHSRIVIMQAD